MFRNAGFGVILITVVIGLWTVNAESQVRKSAPSRDKPVPPPEACCCGPNKDQLCSALPHDITDDFRFGYSSLSPETQRPFDNFSWQMFVALNWPAKEDGTPSKKYRIGQNPKAKRVWEYYPNPFNKLFPSALPSENHAPRIIRDGEEDSRLFITLASTRSNLDPSSFLESVPAKPLIDRNLNFVVYDIRINQTEYDYISRNHLNTVQGQMDFKKNHEVSFPRGNYADPKAKTGGSVGAIEIKTAWRILNPRRENQDKYFCLPGTIYISPDNSDTGKPFSLKVTLGLVGFHIIQRTDGPPHSPRDWIWSTFEHIDNAPLAVNARDATNIQLPLPPKTIPPKKADRTYSFFNPDYEGPANEAPKLNPGETNYLWATNWPYARHYALKNPSGKGTYGTQVVRCWKIFPETEEVNKYFQELLRGTVWGNYQLIGTQWMGGDDPPSPLTNGNIPRYLSNTTLETYIQFDRLGSCLDCHRKAQTRVPGLSANFSFLLQRAK